MPKEHEHSAYRFHADLFLSGLERIVLVSTLSLTSVDVNFNELCPT